MRDEQSHIPTIPIFSSDPVEIEDFTSRPKATTMSVCKLLRVRSISALIAALPPHFSSPVASAAQRRRRVGRHDDAAPGRLLRAEGGEQRDPEEVRRDPGRQGVAWEESYGASGDQSRAVVNGLKADYVNFSLEGDVTRLVKAGLVAEDWNSGADQGHRLRLGRGDRGARRATR